MATEMEAMHVLRLLAQSMAPADPARAASERELQQLLKTPVSAAFLAPLLQQIVLLPDGNQHAQVTHMDANLRLMAVLWLKQYLKQQWKSSSSTKLLNEVERNQMKQVLLFAALHEPNSTIALHLALTLAQIARAEFPNQWKFEALFTPILQALQTSVEQQQVPATMDQQRLLEHRSINLTYRVVKELATRRLMMHRKQFAMLSVEILPLLLQLWNSTATRLSEHLWAHCQLAQASTSTAALETATDRLATLLTLTKLLSTMFLNAFRDLAGIQNGEFVRSALIQFYERLENLVRFRHSIIEASGAGAEIGSAEAGNMVTVVDKCTHRIASIVVSIQKSYPIEFRDYLSPFLNLFWNVLGSLVPGNPFTAAAAEAPRRLQIEALQFFANVLSCRLYKNESLSSANGGSSCVISKVITATGDMNLTDAMVLEAQSAVNSFFSSGANGENRFEVLQQLTVMQYLRLTAKDLEEWQNDPEAYSALTESLTAQESVRACAENLFLTLIQNYPDQTIPGLTQMTAAASSYLAEIAAGAASNQDDPRALDIDAVLLAIGLGCYDLHDCFEFEPWFVANLVPLLVSPDTSKGSIHSLPVLRYRIVWLVSCWLAQLSTSIRPLLYETLLNPAAFFQQQDADAALKLRVVQSLESMVSDWGFEAEAFAPFLPRALECLFTFFPQTEESESKMKILSCLEAIIQAAGPHAVVFCEQISAPLPSMWLSESDASNLVRGKILQLLAKLLNSVEEHRASTGPSITIEQQSQGVLKLVEMCLQVVRFATDVSNPDEVFLMESGLEVWSEALGVCDVYTEELHLLFGNLIRLMKRDYEHVKLAVQILEQYLRLGQSQFWQTYHLNITELFLDLLGNVKAEAALQVARVQELIFAMFASTEEVAVCAPVVTHMVEACVAFIRKDADREPEMVVVGYLSVVARLLLQHFEFTVVHLLKNDQEVLGNALIELMLIKFFAVGSSSLNVTRRKVWALALCSTLSILNDEQLGKTGQILELAVDVLEEEQEEREKEQKSDASGHGENGKAGAYRPYEAHRKAAKTVAKEDTVARETDLRAFAYAKLNELAAKLGTVRFEELLQTVDSSVLRRFQS
uniref:Importin N-terminal domain-containing protein n=1 Tax=Globisporangium ultimum (strain ATCC 200006 / CBS 805.95 / DAOM BR144) TaxID=431595 RepID=K3XAD3_GLOUD